MPELTASEVGMWHVGAEKDSLARREFDEIEEVHAEASDITRKLTVKPQNSCRHVIGNSNSYKHAMLNSRRSTGLNGVSG